MFLCFLIPSPRTLNQTQPTYSSIAIEYAQRLKFYLPELEAKGIENYYLILNAGVDSCKELAQLVDLPAKVCVLSDEMGEAGSAFGVVREYG